MFPPLANYHFLTGLLGGPVEDAASKDASEPGETHLPVRDDQLELMSDNAIETTRSRGRRSRKRQKRNAAVSRVASAVEVPAEKQNDSAPKIQSPTTPSASENQPLTQDANMPAVADEYRVESPPASGENKSASTTKRKKSTMVKSKSLDDDEALKITELSETSEGEDKNMDTCNAVISEAESDVEHKTEDVLSPEDETSDPLINVLDLEECSRQQRCIISPEDELNLRNFLEGLNLVNSPKEAPKKHINETLSLEELRERRAKKREALAQYFVPVYENPRYLDVINEESSDSSDKEQNCDKNSTPTSKTKSRTVQRRMQSHYCKPKSDIAILVPTKLTEVRNTELPSRTENVCSTSVAECSSGAEVVYLNDSSSDAQSESEEESVGGVDGDDEGGKQNVDDGDTCETNNKTLHPPDRTHEDVPLPACHLTPPPTPGSLSPKTGETPTKNQQLISLTEKALTCLATKNSESVALVLCDALFVQLPEEVKNKLKSISTPVQDSSNAQPLAENCVKDNNIEREKPVEEAPPPPSRSPSVSSNGSSSRGTSLCTARYNPMSSSLVDIASLVQDEEEDNEAELQEPFSLREICVSFLLSLPFGRDVLQELAEVSKNLEQITSILPHSFRNEIIKHHTQTQLKRHLDVPLNTPTRMAHGKTLWVGLPIEENPKVLLCLSPKQKDHLEKSKSFPDEAGKLLKLHESFQQRRGYHERFQTGDEFIINSGVLTRNTDTVSNRLLAIVQDAAATDRDNSQSTSNVEDEYLKNQIRATRSITLPRTGSPENSAARLQARDLSEWLQLARCKSTNSVAPTDAAINPQMPTNNLGTQNRDSMQNHPGRPARNRRASLPNEIFERQLQQILEKEREVQRELEQLEDEKRKLQAEMATNVKLFVPDEYNISRNGDIAIYNESRPTSLPASASEYFRQQMYEEYMKQVQARQERKQNKVIKISTHPAAPQQEDTSDDTASLCEAVHVPGIEDEFMSEVRKRNLGAGCGGGSDEMNTSVDQSDLDDDGSEPVLVLDGDAIKGTKELPKHLQEFVDITKQATTETDTDEDEGE